MVIIIIIIIFYLPIPPLKRPGHFQFVYSEIGWSIFATFSFGFMSFLRKCFVYCCLRFSIDWPRTVINRVSFSFLIFYITCINELWLCSPLVGRIVVNKYYLIYLILLCLYWERGLNHLKRPLDKHIFNGDFTNPYQTQKCFSTKPTFRLRNQRVDFSGESVNWEAIFKQRGRWTTIG